MSENVVSGLRCGEVEASCSVPRGFREVTAGPEAGSFSRQVRMTYISRTTS